VLSKRLPEPPVKATDAPEDEELCDALAEALARTGAGVPSRVRRRRSQYRSSFPLEELSVTLERGEELRLAFKRLEWQALGDEAQLAKPRFLFDARREPAVYDAILPAAPSGPPGYVGATARASSPSADDGRWLFVEWVEGRELYQVGERAAWAQVARWLGELHSALAPGVEDHAERAPLLRHDAVYYERWLSRARDFAKADDSSGAAGFLDWLGERHDRFVEALLALPRTVLHGDFFASNVLVAGGEQEFRVAPVDWELAAVGPGLSDLAALISGDWDEAAREDMTAAYASAAGIPRFSARELDFARLQLAIQCLGWAPPQWQAPEGQRHDWLADAIALAGRLEI
jgi:aminoglycoside phosphotransferase (APT) family kinase protein